MHRMTLHLIKFPLRILNLGTEYSDNFFVLGIKNAYGLICS